MLVTGISERGGDNTSGERGGRRRAQRVARHLRAGRAALLRGHHVPGRLVSSLALRRYCGYTIERGVLRQT